MQGTELAAWAAAQGYARYLAASLKGTAEIDWDEPAAREVFVADIFADADRRLVQLGLRQTRYIGRRKAATRRYLTATVANLARILAAT